MRVNGFFKRLALLLVVIVAGGFTPLSAADLEPLVGRWQCPDGGYVLEVRNVGDDGSVNVRDLIPAEGGFARGNAYFSFKSYDSGECRKGLMTRTSPRRSPSWRSSARR